MPTRNISLTDEQDAFIEETVKAGVYQNASEAVRDALRGLQYRREQEELKLQALRKMIDIAEAEYERGEYTEVAEEDLEAYLGSLDKE